MEGLTEEHADRIPADCRNNIVGTLFTSISVRSTCRCHN
jgi:hypothetical protein